MQHNVCATILEALPPHIMAGAPAGTVKGLLAAQMPGAHHKLYAHAPQVAPPRSSSFAHVQQTLASILTRLCQVSAAMRWENTLNALPADKSQNYPVQGNLQTGASRGFRLPGPRCASSAAGCR